MGPTSSEGPKAITKIGKGKAPLTFYFVTYGLGNMFKEDPKGTNMNVKVNMKSKYEMDFCSIS